MSSSMMLFYEFYGEYAYTYEYYFLVIIKKLLFRFMKKY
jgi:hypothetical protein